MANNKNDRQVRINNDAKDFATITFKKYKKHNGDYFDSKKEIKQSYFMYLIDLLPRTIEFVVKYGYINKEEVQNAKVAIYAKINDPDFIKVLKKEIKNGNKIENIKLLPIIIKDILMEAKRVNDNALAADPNAKIYDMSDIIELCQLILKKKIKKMDKSSIPTSVGFDALCIIPCKEALAASQVYRIRTFYSCLYEHAKGCTIPFEKLMSIISDEVYYPVFITFALLERKEKFMKLTDAQKSLYIDISSWCFKVMESLDKNTIEGIVKAYIKGRKRDEAQGKDGNRRYALSTLSEEDFPKINKVINKMISEDDSIKKYV